MSIGRLLPLIALVSATGCFHLPARVCLTPPYDAPAGFSETYHAALAQHEPILRPGVDPLPATSFGMPPGSYIMLPPATTAEPPLDW